MPNRLQGLTLRSEEVDHLCLRVVGTGWAREGMTCVVQVDTQRMTNVPTRIKIEYIVKMIVDGKELHPSIKEIKQLLYPPKKPKPIIICGISKMFNEWKDIVLIIDETQKSVGDWLTDPQATENYLESFSKDE